MNLVGGPCPWRPPDTSTSYRVNVCAIFPGPGTAQPWLFPGGQSRLSPQPPGFRGEMGIWAGAGRGYPASLSSAFLFSNTVGSKETSGGWAWGVGGHPRAPGAPSAPPQTSVFLWPCSARGHRLRGVPEPALHTDASSSIPWPAQGTWPGPLCGEGDTLILATLCRPVPFSLSAHPGEQGGWERRGRTGKTQPKEAALWAGVPAP